jgi:hypothetical protein
MRDAAQAKAALQGMSDAVKAETAAEVAGSAAAAAARQKELAVIREETQALSQLANSAKQTNVQLLYGGRNDMQQHLADMAQELQYTTLLNRQKWLGFSSVQQAMSYRQQLYQLALLENKAHFAGYLTADQYLGFLQRETMQTAALSASIRDRTAAIAGETSALLSHANALQGTHQSAGELGEQLASAGLYTTVLSGIQPVVVTRAEFDDAGALVSLAAYRAALAGIPGAEDLHVIASATRLGGVPLEGRAQPGGGLPPSIVQAEVLSSELAALDAQTAAPRVELAGGPEAVTEAALLNAELEELRRRALTNIGISFDEIEAARITPPSGAPRWSDEVEAEIDALDRLNAEDARPRVEIEGVDEAAADLTAIRAALDALNDTDEDIVITVDGSGAVDGLEEISRAEDDILTGPQGERLIIRPEVDGAEAIQELEDFTRAFEAIPDAETVQAEFDDQAAERDLGSFVDDLTEASRRRYQFQAEFEDEEALDAVNELGERLLSAEELSAYLLPMAGNGGAAGGGGGGPPRPPVMPTGGFGDPGDDPGYWDAIRNAMRGADDEAARAANTQQRAGNAARDAGNAARTAGGWWGLWTRDLQLFGGAFAGIPFVSTISVWALALHTLLDFFIVLVPAVIAAGVALGSFGVAIQPAAQDIYNRFEGLHIALDALTTGDSSVSKAAQHIGFLSDQVGTLNAVMKPVPVTFRTLQDALAPEAVTLYGAAINTLSHGTGLLGTIVQRTGAWVETFAVKLQTALTAESGVLGPLIETALNDLHILGSIGGSIVTIFTELLKAGEITHVSELLFEGIAYALSVVAKALNLVGPDALAAGIAFFAVVHYGGLLVTVMINVWGRLGDVVTRLILLGARLPLVGGAFANFGLDASNAIAGIPAAAFLAVAAAITAVGFAIYSAAQASNAAKTYVGGLQSALANVNASQGFAQIQVNLASINGWLAKSAANSRNFIGNMAQGWADLLKSAPGLDRLKYFWEAITGTNQQPGSTSLVLKEQTAEQKDWTTSLETAAYATKQFGTTAQESFALMDLAGVKVTDSLATQKTKVDDLVTGWLNMGVQGYQLKNGMNQLGAAIDSVSLASELQDSSITTLTGDFSSFLQLVASGETGLETFGSGIYTVDTNLKATGAAMTGVNAASFTLRQSWEAQLTAGQGLYNNLLLQNAAAGNTKRTNAELADSGRDLVSILLAQGGAGRESVQGTYALAQTMGYTGKATYDALEKWSGGNHNVTGTLKDLNKQVGDLETGSSNLNTDVLNLAAAIGTNLNNAIAAGLVGMPQITKAVAGLYQYILDNRSKLSGGITPREQSLSDSVANALVAVYGTTPQGLAQAKDEFLATLSQMGVARQQALALWARDGAKGGFTPKIDAAQAHADLVKLHDQMTTELKVPPLTPPPGWSAQLGQQFAQIFGRDLPHWAEVGWNAAYSGFFNDFWHPIGTFLNVGIPTMFTLLLHGWETLWVQGAGWFAGHVVAPVGTWFLVTVPGFIANTLRLLDGLWSNTAHYFGQYLVSDVSKFFTASVPSWVDGLGRSWNKMWSTGWADFSQHIMQPMEHWFTVSLPNGIWSGLKGGIDKAVGGMNTVIGYINDVTGVVGVHIGKIPSLAAGGAVRMASGSVPGTGDEDGTHVIAMGGEFMLRKPARMALQAQYGPGFLDHLNNADAWLHSGSQGNAASQRQSTGGRYAGGGILGDIGSWLGSAVGDVAGLAKAAWHGIGSAASDVAKYGEQAAFGAMWDLSAHPLQLALEHEGTPGAMGAAWLQDIHTGVESWISGKTQSAEKLAGSTARAGGAAGVVQALAQQMAAQRGWTGAQWADLNAVEMDEAGWNLRAQNPTSKAYGIAQFIDGPAEYAQYGGNAGTAAGQITAWLNYVSQRYGTPARALQHEEEFHWYAVGGPVINAIRAATSNPAVRDSMALGSWLLSKWDTSGSDPRDDEYGAWMINPRKHKGFTTADARNVTKAARLMEPYYSKGVDASSVGRWQSQPEQAALYAAAVAQTDAGTKWTTPSAGTANDGWRDVLQAFRGTPEKQVSSINRKDVAEWSALAPKIHPEWTAAFGNWHHLYNFDKRPDAVPGVSSRSWNEWLAERRKGETDEASARAAMNPVLAHVRNPKLVASSAWGKADRALATWAGEMGKASLAKKDHPEYWKSAVTDVSALEADLKVMQRSRKYNPDVEKKWAGATSNWKELYDWDKRPEGLKRPTSRQWEQWLAERKAIAHEEALANKALSPIFADIHSPQQLLKEDWPDAETAVRRFATALESARLAKAFHPEYFAGAERDLGVLDADLTGAGKAWNAIWGEYLVPGITERNPGHQNITVDLDKLVVGAPFGAGGSGGGNYGFGLAAGGAVPDLAGVAGMFSGGMAAGGTVPDFFIPGLSMSLQKQLQAQAVGEHPRTLADSAGGKGGLHVGQLTINNPKAEKPSDSITRSSNRLAFMAGRGAL